MQRDSASSDFGEAGEAIAKQWSQKEFLGLR